MIAWMLSTLASIMFNTGMRNAPVFPVPFLALASTFLPARAMGIVSSWIGEGISNPFSKIPLSRSIFRPKSSKATPFVAVTSVVRVLNKRKLRYWKSCFIQWPNLNIGPIKLSKCKISQTENVSFELHK